MFDFGLRIQQLRLSHNMSQEELGRRINRSRSVVCGYEINMKIPPLEVLTDIANVFNVSLDYLVGIDKAEMASLAGLNQKQKDLVFQLLNEFKIPHKNNKGLTPDQQKLINDIMVEFIDNNS